MYNVLFEYKQLLAALMNVFGVKGKSITALYKQLGCVCCFLVFDASLKKKVSCRTKGCSTVLQ